MFNYFPKQPKIISEDKKNHSAIFEIEELAPGYGITIGNSLRRVLFSSISGAAAITSFKIKGVSHEFSTIPGIMEDVVEIMLNLKKIRVKLFGGEPQTVFLSHKGEGSITANDIKPNSNVKIINPETLIATATDKKTDMEMELTIEAGIGYSPIEQRKREKLQIGTILLDAIFTPIKKVAYEIENMRIGERTDFNRIKLFIQTDGTIEPQEALNQAALILANHYLIMLGREPLEEVKEETPKPKEQAEEKKAKKK